MYQVRLISGESFGKYSSFVFEIFGNGQIKTDFLKYLIVA